MQNISKYLVGVLVALSTTVLFGYDTLDSEGFSPDHTFEKAHQGVDIGSGWQFLGDLRAGWVQYDYQNPPPADPNINHGHTDSHGFYVMPKLSILTPNYEGVRAKVTLAGASGLGLNDPEYETRNFVLNGSNPKSYLILQEAFLSYKYDENRLVIGRQELTTPMIDADDWYMLANSFELAYYQNTMVEDSSIAFGYFHQMAGVWDSAADGTAFHSMSDTSYISDFDKQRAGDSGVAFGSYNFKNEHHDVQVWDYYGFDLYNILFLQYDYSNSVGGFSYDLGAQVIDFQEVGLLATSSSQSKIDYSLFSLRFDGSFSNGLDFATGVSKYTDGKGQTETLGAWGGYPYFANGMIFHFFEAGSLQNATSYKAQIGYDLSKIGLSDSWIGYRHTYFDLDSRYSLSSQGQQQERMLLNGIRLSYGAAGGAYFTGTYEHVDVTGEPNTFSLRLIGGYRF